MSSRKILTTCPKCFEQHEIDVPTGSMGAVIFSEAKFTNEADVLKLKLAIELLSETPQDTGTIRQLLLDAQEGLAGGYTGEG